MRKNLYKDVYLILLFFYVHFSLSDLIMDIQVIYIYLLLMYDIMIYF